MLERCLAKGLCGLWLPQYARCFLSSATYLKENLRHITAEQILREIDFLRAKPRIAVFDTASLVLRTWWKEKYSNTPEWLECHLGSQAARHDLVSKPGIT